MGGPGVADEEESRRVPWEPGLKRCMCFNELSTVQQTLKPHIHTGI